VDLKGVRDAGRVFATTVIAEALAFHWDWISHHPQDYGSDLRERMEQNKNQATVVYLKAQEERRTIRRVFDEVLKRVDVVAIPTLPIVAPGLEEKEIKIGSRLEMVRTVLLRFTPPANLTGLPAISLPCGFSRENMPIGLQLLGRGFEEATLLRVAYAYEQATPWHEMFPTDKFEDAVRPGSPNPSLPGPVDRPGKSSDRFA
jgi:aspartyl-tRNA(Asn)/glutamyl-tRNA(Gln) amidotransferase subunit A